MMIPCQKWCECSILEACFVWYRKETCSIWNISSGEVILVKKSYDSWDEVHIYKKLTGKVLLSKTIVVNGKILSFIQEDYLTQLVNIILCFLSEKSI